MQKQILFSFLFLLFLTGASLATSSYRRPAPVDRTFVSAKIDEVVSSVAVKIADPELRELWVDCYPNTLDTTVNYSATTANQSIGSTFVITGDIQAMWLRDSTWQVDGYLQYAAGDAHLLAMLKGLAQRQWYSVIMDAYANAFNYDDSCQGHQSDYRTPPMTCGLFEGKFEIDSLCSVLRLSSSLYEVTRDPSFLSPDWLKAVSVIYRVFKYQQSSTIDMTYLDGPLYYSFARQTTVPTDTLLHRVGPPGVRNGMIKSPFRPSDDATRLPFFIPGNAFAVVELRRTAALLSSVLNQTALSKDLGSLADEIDAAIQRYGVVADPDDPSRKIYAFEVDGYGGQYLIDDANVPSLLALPFLGYLDASDPIYQNTRARILGPRNPYWFKGAAGQGIGSPHTGLNNIWPMSIVFQALTSDDPTEIASCLRLLKTSSAGLGFMHESYDKEDPRVFTRSWFAMANSLFGALILRTLQLYPSVLTNLPL